NRILGVVKIDTGVGKGDWSGPELLANWLGGRIGNGLFRGRVSAARICPEGCESGFRRGPALQQDPAAVVGQNYRESPVQSSRRLVCLLDSSHSQRPASPVDELDWMA